MIARQLTALLALLAVAVAMAGCGSSGEAVTAQTTMPKAKYAHKADLICEGASYEQTHLANLYLEEHQNAPEADLVVPAGIPPLEKEIKELRELGLPKGQEKKAELFLEEVEKGLYALKEEPSLALSKEHNPYETANELGEELGLGDCSRNP